MDSSNLSDISMRQYNQQEIKQNKDIQKEIEGMKEIECFLGAIGFLEEYTLCNRYFDIMRASPYGLKRWGGYDDEPIRTTNDFGRSSIQIGRCRKTGF